MRSSTPTFAPVPAGHAYAVLKLIDVRDEDTDAGGKHYTFVIDEPTQRLIHAGGHAIWTQLPGTYFVGDIELGTPSIPRGIGNGFHELPHDYAGEATRFVAARDLAAARQLLRLIRATGWPAQSLTLHY